MLREVKHCTKCKTEDDLFAYSRRKNVNGSITVYFMCHSCNNERHNKWSKENPHKTRIYNRRYLIRKEMNE